MKPNANTIQTLAAVVVCFALLYPAQFAASAIDRYLGIFSYIGAALFAAISATYMEIIAKIFQIINAKLRGLKK